MIATRMRFVLIMMAAGRVHVPAGGLVTVSPVPTLMNVQPTISMIVIPMLRVLILTVVTSVHVRTVLLAMASHAIQLHLRCHLRKCHQNHRRSHQQPLSQRLRLRHCRVCSRQSLSNSSQPKAVYLSMLTSVLSLPISLLITFRLLSSLSEKLLGAAAYHLAVLRLLPHVGNCSLLLVCCRLLLVCCRLQIGN